MEPLVTIAIALAGKEEGLAELVEDALGQSWRRKEILVAGLQEVDPGWEELGAARKAVRRVCVPEGASARAALLRSARGEWVQWLRPGERLSPDKVESQLRESGKSLRCDLLCSAYRLRDPEIAHVFDPRAEALDYAARLGSEFPFAAPLLWSTAALRSLLMRRGDGFSAAENQGLLPWPLFGRPIGLGGEAGSECPGAEKEPTRGEWVTILAWALLLASAPRVAGAAPTALAERERLFVLLRESHASLARRLAEKLRARDLLEKAAPKTGLAAAVARVGGPRAALRVEAAMRELRRAEASFRRRRRELLHWVGLRKQPIPAGREETEWRAYESMESGAYESWIAAYQRLDGADREAMRREIDRFPRRPLLSVVVPVFNSPEKWLQRAIDSVREQLYPDWELCLADDASSATHIRPLLERNRERDPRIRVVFRAENGGISAASNSALELARGEWIVLLDHDDELPEEALYLVAREILCDPEAGLIYSDEDKIDEAGHRSEPYFKPDFCYDLLLSQNCINHLEAYRADLLRSLGGFRSGYDGSQDYDLALRFVERLEPGQIRHIPRVLYHWRMISGSGAACDQAKPYAYEAARSAIGDHLRRVGEPSHVLSAPIPWGHRVRWRAPAKLRVSLLLGAGVGGERLRRSIESIRSRTDYPEYELLVVGGSPGCPEAGGEANEGVRFLAPPTGLTGPRLWNWAPRQAGGEILVFLEAPVEARGGGWLGELVSQALRPEVGAVGARILAPDGSVAEAGVLLGLEGSAGAAFQGWSGESIGYFGQAVLLRNPSAVGGSCLATRKAVWEESGGFDEGYGEGLWDIDYCLRLRKKGYRIVFTPYAELVRLEACPAETPEDRERFRSKWAEVIERDPAYNPNLSLQAEGYGLAWPPRVQRPWRGNAT
ncbi:MAG: glycosyltransferase [Methylacidiphilaceae bacterium]|nr:glycosyltransferase [Candidatus Methylacidiphilaceae bacterium]